MAPDDHRDDTSPPIGFAIIGGMFDPPHLGHVAAVEHACAWGRVLSPAIVVVGGVPPHRAQPHASGADRLAMARAAFAHLDWVEVSDIEIERARSGEPTYMYDTVVELMRRHPGQTPYLVLGDDRAATLPTWHRFPELMELVELLVVTRTVEGDVTETPELQAVRAAVPGKLVHWCPMAPVEGASSDVRALIEAGKTEEISRHVPAAVVPMLAGAYPMLHRIAATCENDSTT